MLLTPIALLAIALPVACEEPPLPAEEIIKFPGGTTQLRVVPLGDLESTPSRIERSSDMLGMTFFMWAEQADVDLSAAGKPLVLDDDIVSGGEASIAIVYDDDGTSRFTVPSGIGDSPDGAEDALELRVGEDASVGEGYAIIREGEFTGGLIDFSVLLASEIDRGHVEEVLALVMEDFAGLSLGQVTFIGLPDEALIVDSREEIRRLTPRPWNILRTPSVSVLVNTGFGPDLSDNGSLLGISPLPGIALQGMHADVLTFRVSEDASYDAIVLRHELGHFAGLFHSEEGFFEVVDAFEDTEDCPNFPGDCDTMESCGCVEPNLMFPAVLDGAARSLSPSQERLIQGSTLYRDEVSANPDSSAKHTRKQTYAGWRGRVTSKAAFTIGHLCEGPLPVLDQADRATLLGLAQDPSVSPAIRRRALEGLTNPTPEERSAIVALASSDAPRSVLLGVISALGKEHARQVVPTKDRAVREHLR
jgi:hypothetical protein